MRVRFCRAASLMFPRELYIKYDESSSAKRKILESWLVFSSTPANPSESMTMTSMSSPEVVFDLMV